MLLFFLPLGFVEKKSPACHIQKFSKKTHQISIHHWTCVFVVFHFIAVVVVRRPPHQFFTLVLSLSFWVKLNRTSRFFLLKRMKKYYAISNDSETQFWTFSLTNFPRCIFNTCVNLSSHSFIFRLAASNRVEKGTEEIFLVSDFMKPYTHIRYVSENSQVHRHVSLMPSAWHQE